MAVLSFRTVPASNFLVDNPVMFELFSDTQEHPVTFDIEVAGETAYAGVFLPTGAGPDFEANIPVQDILKPYFVEPAAPVSPDSIVSEVERMYVDFTVHFRQDTAELTHTARVYRGGVSKEMLRFLRDEGGDIFTYRLMNTQRQFFMTSRTLGAHIVLRDTELSPLCFIATGKTHRVTTDTGETYTFPATEPGKVYAFNLEALIASLAQKPKRLTIPLFLGFSLTVDIVESARVPDRFVIEFTNSYGVPERLEVTGKCEYEPETANESFNAYDATVDDYVERGERQQLREIVTAESGYKTRDELMFMRDLLQSDRHWLTDAAGIRREVRVTAENFSHVVFPFEPESVTLTVRFVDGDTQFTPEPVRDDGLDRIFMLTFNILPGRELIYLPFTGNVDLMIDWGDGTEETVTADNPMHTYAAPGEYTVAATGHADRLSQVYALYPPNYQANYQQNVTAVDRWGDLGHDSLYYAFYGCSNLRAIERKPKYLFEKVTRLDAAFSGCTSLSAIFESMDAPLLEMANSFCSGCSSLEYIPDRLFSKCPLLKEIRYAFQNCTSLVHVSVSLFADNTELIRPDALFHSCVNLKNGVTFHNNKKILTFESLYSGCSSLETLPDYCFMDTPAISFERTFSGCTSLTSLPEHILAGAGNAFNFAYFAMNSGLQSLPAGLFADCPNALNFSYAFANSALQAVPENLFQGNPAIANFYYTFSNCKGLVEIPVGLFRNCVAVTSFEYCFYRCTNLTVIYADLFRYNVNASNFSYVFTGCTKLPSIPSGLFKYNANATNMYGIFWGCSLITSVPGDIFAYIADSASTNINYCFYETGITAIDENIFAHLTQITQLTGIFAYTPLSVIPSNLFASNTELTRMSFLFQSTPVTDIPGGLLATCTKLRDVSQIFYECNHLTGIPNLLFDSNKDIISFVTAFYGCTSLQGISPSGSDGLKLWERAGQPGYPAGINGVQCFRNCTGLDDYDTIPSNWK